MGVARLTEPVEKPSRPDDIGANTLDSLAQLAVSGHDGHLRRIIRCLLDEHHDRVVAAARSMDDAEFAVVVLRDAPAGNALEHDDDGRS